MKKPTVALTLTALCAFSVAALPVLQPTSSFGTAISAFLERYTPVLHAVHMNEKNLRKVAPQTTYFSQDFSSSTVVSSYINATTPSSGQFNAIGSSGPDMVLSINNGRLQFTRNGANAGSYSRTTDFSPVPSTLKFSLELTVSGNAFAQTNAAVFQIGSGFGTANSTESNANTFARFGVNWTTTDGQWSVREIGTSVNSSSVTGTRTLSWFLNNSGSSLSYLAPDGSIESLANDRADLWIGNTRVFNDYTVTTTTQTLTDLKFAFTGGTGTIQIDNILVEDIPPVDTTPPDTMIDSGPTGTVASTSATFTYSSTEAGSTFECSLDGAAFGICPASYTDLSQGSHTFEVRAIDPSGNTDPTPASRTWTVDTAPDTTITSGPSGTVTSSDATFQFSSNEAGSTFECSLDGAAFAACSTGVQYNGLANGNHYFEVRAIDAANNTDDSPDSRTFTVRAGTGAVTFVVDRLDDSSGADECIDAISNDCSLRRAIGTSENGDIITFAPSLYSMPTAPEGAAIPTIELGGTEIPITTDITITGPGASLLTVDGNGASRIYNVGVNLTVNMSGLTLTGGNAVSGGAINVNAGASLSLDQVNLSLNSANTGGAVYSEGTLTISHSAIVSNSANFGAGVAHQGGLTVTSSTFSDNGAGTAGGGIISLGGSAVIRGVTMTLNNGGLDGGGGIACYNFATVDLGNSIVSNNTQTGTGPEILNLCGGVSSSGFNLVGNDPGDSTNTGGAIAYQASDITDVPPRLGPLQANGGSTPTHGFEFSSGTSPAIDAGSSFGLTIDQRGLTRKIDVFNATNADDATDIGAYELQAPTAAPANIAGRVMTSGGAAIRGAVVTVQAMDGGVWSATTNTFGYYRIEGLPAGASYLVSVNSRRYSFPNGTQLVNLEDNVSGLDFTASP